MRPTAAVLARVYPQAVAGTPLSMSFDPGTGRFSLTYRSTPAVHAPTVIAVPALQ